MWPAVPADVRDDLAMLRVERLRAQVPTLYLTLVLVVLTTMWGMVGSLPPWIAYFLPLSIVAISGLRMLWWLRRRGDGVTPEGARRLVVRTVVIAAGICLLASFWTSLIWLGSPLGQRTYYPLFMSIGTLAAAFCLSSVRFATVIVLVTGIGPILAVAFVAGDNLDRMAVLVILLASAFLMRMIQQQHAGLVDVLRLQRHMAELAATDALTGLCNRRALYLALDRQLGGAGFTGLVLLDLDGFKPVNDAHGHATGDRLLIAVAERLRAACQPQETAYRLGGDEFAILAPFADEASTRALSARLLASLAAPFAIDGHRIAVGASAGLAHSRPDDTGDSLIARADERLYAAKAMRGGERRRSTHRARRREGGG